VWSGIVSTSFITVRVLCIVVCHVVAIGSARAQETGADAHEPLTDVACVDLLPGERRAPFGCVNVGAVTGLHFGRAPVYWHLRGFPNRRAAEAAKSATGIVAEEDGRVWLSELGDRHPAPLGGEFVAVVGPLHLPPAGSYAAVLSYAVLRPGDSFSVHTHPGPESWYVLAGEQCLETPAGVSRAHAGGSASVATNTPMVLSATGTRLRRAFALVINDSAQSAGRRSDWKPSGACRR
jgi:quercetin dioxygenase-like cupin family protein